MMASLPNVRLDFGESCELTLESAFDNGHLRTNPEEAQKLIDTLGSIMSDEQVELEHPLLIAFKSIWLRLSRVSMKSPSFLYSSNDNCRLPLRVNNSTIWQAT